MKSIEIACIIVATIGFSLFLFAGLFLRMIEGYYVGVGIVSGAALTLGFIELLSSRQKPRSKKQEG